MAATAGPDADKADKTVSRMTDVFEALPAPPRKGVHWVTPKLVGEFGFTEWTEDNRLRHPRFLGLRRDKKPREVVRERPVEAS